MNPVEAAILRTITYGDVFEFPMTVEEIHHFLIHDRAVPLEQIRSMLQHSPVLQTRIYCHGGYIALAQRPELVSLRAKRELMMQHLWPRALHYGRWLARIPFVRMVALTGALAARNPGAENDDIDYILVTVPGRVWLARGCAVLLVRFARLYGVEVCPNYILASDALCQQRRDLYIAREIAQTIPLYGLHIYHKLHEANPWAAQYMPNATPVWDGAQELTIGRIAGWMKAGLEKLLGGRPGDWLEGWEYRRKQQRFHRAAHLPGSAAQIDSSTIKGHFNDHGHPILKEYQRRMRQYGLEEAILPLAGD